MIVILVGLIYCILSYIFYWIYARLLRRFVPEIYNEDLYNIRSCFVLSPVMLYVLIIMTGIKILATFEDTKIATYLFGKDE